MQADPFKPNHRSHGCQLPPCLNLYLDSLHRPPNMGSLTKQSSRLFNLKLVRKYLFKGNNTHPRGERGSQSSPGQHSEPKGEASDGSSCCSTEFHYGRPESESSHEDYYQHHQAHDEILDTFLRPSPGESNKDIKALLQKKQYPALLSPSEIQSLEPPSPPPGKPLPKIPTQVRPQRAPQRVPRVVDDPRVPARNLQNTQSQAREAGTAHSAFPKSIAVPPRTTSLTTSSRFPRETHSPQRPPRSYATAATHAPQHIAKFYDKPSKKNEELIEESIYEPLGRFARNSLIQNSITDSQSRQFLSSPDNVITHIGSKVAQPLATSPRGSAPFLTPVGYNGDEDTPIPSQLSLPKDLRPKASFKASRTADALACRPTTASQEPPLALTIHGRGPTRASLESGTGTNSFGNPIVTPESSPKTSHYQRPVNIGLKTSRSTSHLFVPDSERRPMLTKKSAPNHRMGAKPKPLQLSLFPQLPQPPGPT